MKNNQIQDPATSNHPMDLLLQNSPDVKVPKVGDLIEGTIISISKNEIYLDLAGITTGVIRGREVYDESSEFSNLKAGDIVQATVIGLDNENGYMELSFREAGHKKAWDQLEKFFKEGKIVDSKVIDANKGGLMIKIGNVIGFLPVSQLTIEHYPRIEGGDRNKILVHLKSFANQLLRTKIIDLNEKEEKLIVSEKAAWDDKQKKAISQYQVGDKIKGKVTGVVDFGAFVEFGDNLEGLVHISELAWQRIDNPRDIIKVGDVVETEIIEIVDTKVSLSIKKLQKDPWVNVNQTYKIGQKVKGLVLKVNPFGAFVELDKDIHGLVHVSELSDKKVNNLENVITIGKEYDFYILSIEPENHRLGLSLKAKTEKKVPSETETKDSKTLTETKAKSETTKELKTETEASPETKVEAETEAK